MDEVRIIYYQRTKEFEIEINKMLKDGYRLMPESLRPDTDYIFLRRLNE